MLIRFTLLSHYFLSLHIVSLTMDFKTSDFASCFKHFAKLRATSKIVKDFHLFMSYVREYNLPCL